MRLLPVHLPADAPAPPADVRRFLREARRRIDRFQRAGRAPAFVASDFERVYAALRFLDAADLPAGRWFCEWGSGFGVVSCLAALLGFEAWGIEVDAELVEAARRLAADFALPVEFALGNFIPRGAEARVAGGQEFAWLSTGGISGYEKLGIDPDEFDVI